MPRRVESSDHWTPPEPTSAPPARRGYHHDSPRAPQTARALTTDTVAHRRARAALEASWVDRDRRYGIGRPDGMTWQQVEAVRRWREDEALELDWMEKVLEAREWLPRCRVDGRTPSIVARATRVA